MLRINSVVLESEQTALSSVDTPEMTNIKRKEMMISRTSDCPSEPAGTVPKNASGVTSSARASVPLARIDPIS